MRTPRVLVTAFKYFSIPVVCILVPNALALESHITNKSDAITPVFLGLKASSSNTVLTIRSRDVIKPSFFVLDNPARLILDAENARLKDQIDPIFLSQSVVDSVVDHSDASDNLSLTFYLDASVADIETYQSSPTQWQVRFSYDELATNAETSRQANNNASDSAKDADAEELESKSPWLTDIEYSGTWEHEWTGYSANGHVQKSESLVQPRMNATIAGDLLMTAIARLRFDAIGDTGPSESKPDNYSAINGPLYNSSKAELSLRELYLDADWLGAFWRLGKQQVVWGQADGLKVLDVINPQSFREFVLDEFDDSRIPLWMFNVEAPIFDDSTVQLLWIPDTTYHELAEPGSLWELSASAYAPSAQPGVDVTILNTDKPSHWLDDSELGLRFSTFLDGWDLTLNYLYHYQDSPVLYQSLVLGSGTPQAFLSPEYERNHLLGGTFSNAFGPVTLRGEVVYNSDTFHLSDNISAKGIEKSSEIATVIGLDWQAPNNTFISGQWFQSRLKGVTSDIIREETENTLSLLYQRDFSNEAWQVKFLGLHSLQYHDSWLQFRLKHYWLSELEIWVGADVFDGDDNALFGQFSDQDRIVMGFKYGF